VEETLRTGEVVVVHDRAGLAHVAVPLLLGGRPMGAIIAGQVFDEYPQPLRLQQVAQIRHVSNQELWKAATRSVPVRGATLRTYGELLKSLGQAFMHERYAVVLSRNLETALQEKIILLKEVHHRVKNNLAVIAALLGMQADSLGDHKAITPLLESQQRVHAIALTHEHLYGTQNLKSIRFDEYADQLATDLCATYSSPPNVRVVVDAEPIELDLDHAIPCGLVLNELLSNAFKYAFPGGRSGALTVGFERNAEGLLTLSVEDDGVGLPEGFDWRNSSSLGLRIVQILASQLEGDVELRSQGGTRVEFTFPNREPASPSVAVIG
jgi:two-component sensor histidine kinase